MEDFGIKGEEKIIKLKDIKVNEIMLVVLKEMYVKNSKLQMLILKNSGIKGCDCSGIKSILLNNKQLETLDLQGN